MPTRMNNEMKEATKQGKIRDVESRRCVLTGLYLKLRFFLKMGLSIIDISHLGTLSLDYTVLTTVYTVFT